MIRKLSNYAGKAFIFTNNCKYSPHFFKGYLFGGICLNNQTKSDDGKISLMNIIFKHTLGMWLLLFKVSLISVGRPYEAITER